MRKKLLVTMLICLLVIGIWIIKDPLRNTALVDSDALTYEAVMKRDILCLMMAYPGYITGVEQGQDGKVYLVLKSGRRMLYDDQRVKSYGEKLANTDVQDMMEQIYPLEDIKELMPENFDPGRFRVYALLEEVYGASRKQVESNLVNVRAGYQFCLFNSSNKAADALQSVMWELVPLTRRNPHIQAAVFPMSGTFNYRYISGTGRLSSHSFGIAIDLARDKRDYWKWASRREGEKRLASYPREIVRIFEKHNFIWGGKWGHFDILHFEYRPELILKERYFAQKPQPGKPWHNGLGDQNPEIEKYIRLIEEGLR